MIQKAISQQLHRLFEPLFSDGSYGFRPGRSAQQTIYFDTLNHELLLNLLRKQIQDKRVTELVKKISEKWGYGERGAQQNGGRLSARRPLISTAANMYLNEFDQEMKGRGVKMIRYADDIVVLTKSKRAAARILESCWKYLENKLRLQMNTRKSKVVSVVARKHFKFLGFALGKNGKGLYIRAHSQSLAKAKKKLKELTSRSQGRNVRQVMEKVKVYIRGWIGYYYVADMKRILQIWSEWLRRRLRMYIWKQWKPKTNAQNLCKLGVPGWQAYQWGNFRLGYWRHRRKPCTPFYNKRKARTGRIL